MHFSHATLPNNDQTVVINQQDQGGWMGKIKPLALGKWYIDLLPLGENWRLTGVLPKTDVIGLTLTPAL